MSGELMQFIITKAELAKAASDTGFRLMVVTKQRPRARS